MQQKDFSKWLKLIILGIGLCGLVIYLFAVPFCGKELVQQNPEYAYCYLPWLIFILLTAIPCYIVLVFSWKIVANIEKDHSFCKENAKYLKYISLLAAGDSAFFFVGNIIYLFLGMNHPGILLASGVITFIGIAITVASAALSHLVMKAAQLQEENDLTI